MIVELIQFCTLLVSVLTLLVAVRALSIWQKELKGKGKYEKLKELLYLIEKIRFTIHLKDGGYQFISMKDLDEKDFFKKYLMYKDSVLYFDQSIMSLNNYFNMREDIFLDKKITKILNIIVPSAISITEVKKQENIFVSLVNATPTEGYVLQKTYYQSIKDIDDIFCYKIMSPQFSNLTVQQYFQNWNKLIKLLKKEVF
jgi:hypothetical protein